MVIVETQQVQNSFTDLFICICYNIHLLFCLFVLNQVQTAGEFLNLSEFCDVIDSKVDYENMHGFELESPFVHLRCYCASSEEKKVWVQHLNTMISKLRLSVRISDASEKDKIRKYFG